MPRPQAAPCPECLRLLNDFKSENQLITDIHGRQAQAAIHNDPQAFEALKTDLTRVRKRRDSAAEALKRHLQGHTR